MYLLAKIHINTLVSKAAPRNPPRGSSRRDPGWSLEERKAAFRWKTLAFYGGMTASEVPPPLLMGGACDIIVAH